MRLFNLCVLFAAAVFASYAAYGQTEPPATTPARDGDARLSALEQRVAMLENRVASLSQSVIDLKRRRTELSETSVPAETVALRAENRRLKQVLETLSAKGIPWASLATAPDPALETRLSAVAALVDSYRQTVDSTMDPEEKTAALKEAEKKILAYGAIAIAGIRRSIANLPDDASENGRRALDLLLAIASVRESLGVQAAVIDYQPSVGQIVLDKGLRDGLAVGRSITIIRGGQYIAQAVIDQAYSDICRAKIAGDSKPVRIGDQAFSLRPLSIILPDDAPSVDKK